MRVGSNKFIRFYLKQRLAKVFCVLFFVVTAIVLANMEDLAPEAEEISKYCSYLLFG